MVKIVGCCHPKARSEDYVGPQLTKRRMEASWQAVRGRPILDNHDWNRQVGQVLDVWVDGEDQLWIMAEVDENTSVGAEVAQRIRSGQYQGLSLGMQHGVVKNTAASASGTVEQGWEGVSKVSWSEITEVSVCERGKYPNTILTSHFSKNPAAAADSTLAAAPESGGPPILLSVEPPTPSEKVDVDRKLGSRGHTPPGQDPLPNNRKSSLEQDRVQKSSTVFGSLLRQHPFGIPTPTYHRPKMSDTTVTATTPTTTAAPVPTNTTTAAPVATPAAAQQQQQAAATPMETQATQEVPATTGKQEVAGGGEKQEQQTEAAKQEGGAADKKQDTTSEGHKLAMMRLEMQKFRQERAAEAAEAKKVAAELARAKRDLQAFSSSAREVVGVGSREEFEKLAEQKRSEMRKAAHVKAQDVLSTMYDWVNEAETPSGKAAIATMANGIQRFVNADKELLKSDANLAEVISSTEILHTAKSWADKRVAAEQAKTAGVEKQLAEMQTILKAELNKRAAIEKEFNTLKRQVELMAPHAATAAGTPEAAKAAAVPPAMQTGGAGSMGFENPLQRTTLNSMASATAPAPAQQQQQQPTSATPFGSLLSSLINPGDKRTYAQSNMPATPQQARATTTTTTTTTLKTEASANPPAAKRSRTASSSSSVYIYEVPKESKGFDRVGGSLVTPAHKSGAAPGEFGAFGFGIRRMAQAQGGITQAMLSGVDEAWGGFDMRKATSTTERMQHQQQPMQGNAFYANGQRHMPRGY